MAYTLYGAWLSGPSYKAGLMLSLCGQSFVYRHIDLAKGMHKAPDFLAINRYGQVPALRHDDNIVVQSNVIVEYLADLHGKFVGAGHARWQAKEWMAWEADRLAPPVYRTRFFTRFAPSTDPVIQKYFRDAADNGLKVLEAGLAGRDWLVGNAPSIADVACWSPIAFAAEGNIDLGAFANIRAWSERMAQLPGFKLPYDLMPKSDVG